MLSFSLVRSATLARVLVLTLLGGCSQERYEPFKLGEKSAGLGQVRWAVGLPFESGAGLTLNLVSSRELLAFERRQRFHLTKFFLDSSGQPEGTLYRALPNGDSCEQLNTGQILVVGDGQKHVALLDGGTLVPQFSTDLAFQTGSRISFSGRKRVAKALVFYHTSVEIERNKLGIPNVSDLKYDFHVLSLPEPSVRSIAVFSWMQLPLLEDTVIDAAELMATRRSAAVDLGTQVFRPDKFFLSVEVRS